jgi:hypothetical protein
MMRTPMMRVAVTLVLGLLVVASSSVRAAGLTNDHLRVQRKEVFEFTEKPSVSVDGDHVTITFAVKDYCDATVAIEQRKGRILRHLASGVLGDSAPEPFQQGSLEQKLVWDGKDEIGRYIDDRSDLVVRVSLGLKAQMERTLFWSPQKMNSIDQIQMAATPEGVYVLHQGFGEHIRLFDHEGNYVRAVYPFPPDGIQNVRGIEWRAFPPDGKKLPSKLRGHDQDSFLDETGFNGMVAGDGRLYLLGNRLTVIGTGPDCKGTVLHGPVLGVPLGKKSHIAPTSGAVSPDGTWLYVTGYIRPYTVHGHRFQDWMHAVCRVRLDRPDATREVFAGKLAWSKEGAGGGDKLFRCPMSVACDAKGRVYVADHFNNRVQVFKPDGTLYKTLPVQDPSLIRVDRKTGRLYVFSWATYFRLTGKTPANCAPMKKCSVSPALRVFESIEKPQEIASYSVPYVPRGGSYRARAIGEFTATADVDFTTNPPTIWLAPGVTGPHRKEFWKFKNIRLLVPKGRKLVEVRNFQSEANKMLARARPPRHGRPHVYVNPVSGHVYIGEHTQPTVVACKSFFEVLVVDPDRGRVALKPLPTDTEDMGFDFEGRAYLRTYNAIARFDSKTWREIPYDYGEKRAVYHGAGGGGERPFHAASAITLPSVRGGMFHLGGVAVAPDGTVAVSCINPKKPRTGGRGQSGLQSGNEGYTPSIYPGRTSGWEVHMFDRHGKLLKDDLAPGLNHTTALRLDRDRNLYALAAGAPYIDGKPYFNGRGCTLIKLAPGKMKGLATKAILPLPPALRPNRKFDIARPGIWVEGAEWLFGPVGAEGHYGSGGHCSCYVQGNFDLDYYGRSFAMEIDRYRAVVLDKNGNVILRIGRYGNVDDGVPLVKPRKARDCRHGYQPPKPRSIGGDEVAIMHAQNLAVHSDRRLFLADVGNQCVRSVRLDYHTTESVYLGGSNRSLR